MLHGHLENVAHLADWPGFPPPRPAALTQTSIVQPETMVARETAGQLRPRSRLVTARRCAVLRHTAGTDTSTPGPLWPWESWLPKAFDSRRNLAAPLPPPLVTTGRIFVLLSVELFYSLQQPSLSQSYIMNQASRICIRRFSLFLCWSGGWQFLNTNGPDTDLIISYLS